MIFAPICSIANNIGKSTVYTTLNISNKAKIIKPHLIWSSYIAFA